MEQTDYHYRQFGKTQFEDNNYYDESKIPCIGEKEAFDIRLDKLVFTDRFDGPMENLSEGAVAGLNEARRDTNEIGLFLTIQEIVRGGTGATRIQEQDTANKNQIDNRLIYTSFSRKPGHPINQKNKTVYSGTNLGNDLRFILEVREFDKKNGEGVMDLINLLSDEATKYAQAGTPIIGDVLDKLGNAAKNGLFRDDVIAAYDMEFVPCGVYPNKNQAYLAEGQFLFLRHSQKGAFSRVNPLKWDKEKSVPTKYDATGKKDVPLEKSFVSFHVYERN